MADGPTDAYLGGTKGFGCLGSGFEIFFGGGSN